VILIKIEKNKMGNRLKEMGKKIKEFSAFAGYGTDNFALKQLGIPYECVGFSEIDKYAIQCFQQNHKNVDYYGNGQSVNVVALILQEMLR
jgi:site-specific DNA-cytosine methylase